MGTNKYSCRNKLASWRLYRCWCVAWLVVCQFPIPIAHSHGGLAHLNPLAWQDHLQVYHPEIYPPEICPELGCDLVASPKHPAHDNHIHWHWILPGDLTVDGWGSQSNDRPLPIASPLGFWGGGSGAAAGQDTPAIVACFEVEFVKSIMLELHQEPCWFPKTRSLSLACEAPLDPRPTLWSSFSQSYLGIRLRELFGVCLV